MPILESALDLPNFTAGAPSPSRVVFKAMDIGGVVESPFTGAQQIIEWPGASQWSAEVELPPMTRANGAALWLSFLANARGVVRTFMLGPPDAKTPRGIATGTPLVNGVQVKDSFDLSIKGFTPSITGILKQGDYLEVLNHLHMIVEEDVDSDGSGNAVASIWPACRSAYGDGASIILNSPRCRMRLAKATRDLYDADAAKIYHIAFSAVEAR
ncbi:MAG: hypothetical protein L0312_26620 [Acidobacteria bacterium]|nr:hypothetical protein [Acidobacteriota bacterium]